MKAYLILLSAICILFTGTTSSQIKFLSGRISDKETKKNIANVTVVASSKDGKFLAGTTSDSTGYFKLLNLNAKKLKMRFSIIGYELLRIDTTYSSDIIDLGDIFLEQTAVVLKGVEIKTQKDMVEYYIDKQVINMDKVPGGAESGSDALRNTGIVDVDPISKKVSVHGINMKITIDGKPSPIAETLLSQMPADMIDKIEVMTIPSSREEAEGAAGIINIITKIIKQESYNGIISVYGNSKKDLSPNMMLNYRTGKINIFSSIAGAVGNEEIFQTGRKINFSSENAHSIFTNEKSKPNGNYLDGVLGIDVDYDSCNSFSITGEYVGTKRNIKSLMNSITMSDNDLPVYSAVQKTTTNTDYNNKVLTAFYKHIFSKESEIATDFYYTNYKNYERPEFALEYDYLSGYPVLQNSEAKVSGQTLVLKSDYSNRMGKSGKVEAGYRFTLRNRINTYSVLNYSYFQNTWKDSLNNSNGFKYIENIPAFYVTYSNNISDWEYKFGLRTEYTKIQGIPANSIPEFTNEYMNVFPTFALSYKINDQLRINFNSARRISRPDLDAVDPFTSVTGPNNISQGNINLKPSFTNLFELGINPYINTYYSFSTGRSTRFTATVKDSITLTTGINGAASKTYGIDLTLPLMAGSAELCALPVWLKMLNIRMSFDRTIESAGYLNDYYSIKNDSWSASLNTNLSLWYKIKGSLSFLYFPYSEDQRFTRFSRTYLSISLGKSFLNDKLLVKMNFNDILDGNKSHMIIKGSNYFLEDNFSFNTRSIGILFRYNFNDFSPRDERYIDDGRDGGDKNL